MDAMNSIATMEALALFGFLPDPHVMSDGCPGMSYDLGGFKLTAGQFLSLRMQEVVSFGAIYSTKRSLGMVDFDMPRRLESYEQCAAWIAWHLNEQLPRRENLINRRKIDWVIFGLQHQDTLPWVRRKAAYSARPHCSVRRDWLRLALKSLAQILATAAADVPLELAFDGTVLSIRCGHEVVVLAAAGLPWADRFNVSAKRFREHPGRFMRETLEVAVWEDRLTIGGKRYGEAVASTGFATFEAASVQGELDAQAS